MATPYPTLQDLVDSGKDYFTPREIAGVLGVNPYTINIMVRDCPERLGFPAIMLGKRVKIPAIPFLRKMGVDV